MALHKIFIAGFGGQGIILIGQMLAYAGMLEGKEVTFLPSYGPEMRGGTANCTVIVSDTPISCPIVDQATCLAAMNQPSLAKFEDMVEPGGSVFVNSSLVTQEGLRKDVSVHKIPAGDMAQELGNPKTANIVMLGALVRELGVVKPESMERVLEEVFSGSKAGLLTINQKAFYAFR